MDLSSEIQFIGESSIPAGVLPDGSQTGDQHEYFTNFFATFDDLNNASGNSSSTDSG
jgi:hypothetical protein